MVLINNKISICKNSVYFSEKNGTFPILEHFPF